MRFSRAAMGRNPLQTTLIDSADMAVFGEPISKLDADRLRGQQERVETIMIDGYWRTIPQLQKLLKHRFGQLYSETSISARIRAMRKRGYIVTHARTRAGSNLYQYRAVKAESEAA